MTERVYTTIDKSEWGQGEWTDEPDKVQWKDEATGLACLAVRGPGGHWCGYVGVPPEHPAHGKDYDAVHDLFPNYDEDGALDVHGGLTFASECAHGPEESSICHVPDPGEADNVWWLGFDCAHSGDYSPKYARNEPIFARAEWESYKTLAYVRRETTQLAAQLASLGVRVSVSAVSCLTADPYRKDFA